MDIDKVLAFVTILAWAIYILFAAVLFFRMARTQGLKKAAIRVVSVQFLLPLLIPLSINLVSASLVFVYPQEVGVVISAVSPKGIRERPLESGLHWIVPFLEKVVRYPIYWQTYTMSTKPLEGDILGDDAIVARTADGQEVALDCSVIFKIDPGQANRVHIDWQNRYIQDLVRPAVRGIVRSLVSAYTVDEVNSDKRKDLEASLDNRLRSVLEDKGFILDQFLLRNIDFSDVYRASVEEKQVALQQATQKEHEADQIRRLSAGQADQVRIMASGEADAILVKAKAEAQARVIKAQADAEALRLVGAALTARPDLLTYEYIQKLSPSIRTMLLPSNTPFILPLPTSVFDQSQMESLPSMQTPLITDNLTSTLNFTFTATTPAFPSPTPMATAVAPAPTPAATPTPAP